MIIGGYAGGCLAPLGEFAAGETSAEQAVRIAEAAGHQFSLVAAYRALGIVHLGRGDAGHASVHSPEAEVAVRRRGSQAELGKQERAREHLGMATAMYREMDMQFWREHAEAETTALG